MKQIYEATKGFTNPVDAILIEEFIHILYACGALKYTDTYIENTYTDQFFKNGKKKKKKKVTYAVGYLIRIC